MNTCRPKKWASVDVTIKIIGRNILDSDDFFFCKSGVP